MHQVRTGGLCGRGASRHRLNPSDITFVILAKNEESNIEACVLSLPAGSQALVYDARSSDRTADIARSHGARVVTADWQGFAQARTAAAALVQTPWTFMLDADERLTEGLRAELLACAPADETRAYSVARKNYFCGRWIRGAGWWPDRLVRLFRTGAATISKTTSESIPTVHERWTIDGTVEQLTEPLEHYSYQSIASYKEKFSLYTSLESQATSARGSFASVIIETGLVPLRAVWLLFARRGILDGWQGAYVSLGSACYPAAAKWKAWNR